MELKPDLGNRNQIYGIETKFVLIETRFKYVYFQNQKAKNDQLDYW